MKSDSDFWTNAESLQLCPTLCDPIDGSPPGCPVPGILQARTLEWVAISFSNAWKWKVKVRSLIRVRPSATPWTAAYQGPPSMGTSRQEHWSGVPLPSPSELTHNYISTLRILFTSHLKFLSSFPSLIHHHLSSFTCSTKFYCTSANNKVCMLPKIYYTRAMTLKLFRLLTPSVRKFLNTWPHYRYIY